MADSLLAVPLLTLTAAAFFGMSANAVRAGLRHLDSRTGAIISIGATVGGYLLVSPLWMRFEDWTNPGLLLFAGFGLLHPWLSRYMAYEANRRVGATVSATFEANSPLFTAALAIIFLGEQLTVLLAVGTLMTVAGIAWVYWNREVAASIMRAAALLAMGAMVLRGLLIFVTKIGLVMMPNPVMGAFAAYAVSLACALAYHFARAGGGAIPLVRGGGSWFLLTGVLTATGTFCLFTALLHGQVVVVSPILASYPLFTMLTAWLLTTERLSRHAVGGIVLTVAGVVLVSFASGRG
jgi:drug/metabolite transporter (DMT)-like permease